MIPIAAEDILFASETFYTGVAGADILLVAHDVVGGQAGLRVIIGDDAGDTPPGAPAGARGQTVVFRQARFVTGEDAAHAWRVIDPGDGDPLSGRNLFYHQQGAQALARLYDPATNGFTDPLVVADGVTSPELGTMIDHDDGRILFTAPNTRSAPAGAGDDTATVFAGRHRIDGGDGVDSVTVNWTAAAGVIARFGEEVAILRRGAPDHARATAVENIAFNDGEAPGEVFAPGRDVDALAYIASHADPIAAFGADRRAAFEHDVTHGMVEGRGLDDFGASAYLASNLDLLSLFGDRPDLARRHWVADGFREGRPRDAFDAFSHLAVNADLIAVLGPNTGIATHHFVTGGFDDGRPTGAFGWRDHLTSHADLRAASGAEETAAARHFIEFGFLEGEVDDVI